MFLHFLWIEFHLLVGIIFSSYLNRFAAISCFQIRISSLPCFQFIDFLSLGFLFMFTCFGFMSTLSFPKISRWLQMLGTFVGVRTVDVYVSWLRVYCFCSLISGFLQVSLLSFKFFSPIFSFYVGCHLLHKLVVTVWIER